MPPISQFRLLFLFALFQQSLAHAQQPKGKVSTPSRPDEIHSIRFPLAKDGEIGMAFTSYNSIVIADTGEYHFWDLKTNKIRSVPLKRVTAVHLADDGSRLVASTKDELRLFDVAKGEVTDTIKIKKEEWDTVFFSPDSKTLAVGGKAKVFKEGSMRFWDIAAKAWRKEELSYGRYLSNRIQYSPDSKSLIVQAGSTYDRVITAKILDPVTLQEKGAIKGAMPFAGPTNPKVFGLLSSTDSKFFACLEHSSKQWTRLAPMKTEAKGTLGHNFLLYIWDFNSRLTQRVNIADAVDEHQSFLTLSPDKRTLVFRTYTQRFNPASGIHLIDSKTGKKIAHITLGWDYCRSMAMSPDGQKIAAIVTGDGASDRLVRVWDLKEVLGPNR